MVCSTPPVAPRLHGRPAHGLAAARPPAAPAKSLGTTCLFFLLYFMGLLLNVPRSWQALTGMLVGSIMMQFGSSFAGRHACWPHQSTLRQKKKKGKWIWPQWPYHCNQEPALEPKHAFPPFHRTYLCCLLLFCLRAGRPCLSLTSVL